jgi:hypothetical protein
VPYTAAIEVLSSRLLVKPYFKALRWILAATSMHTCGLNLASANSTLEKVPVFKLNQGDQGENLIPPSLILIPASDIPDVPEVPWVPSGA